MGESSVRHRTASDESIIAEQLVRARLDARVLAQYPGAVPADFAAAYRIQDAAIARWPDSIGGWKVSKFMSPEQQAECGEERLMGPVFASRIYSAAAGQVIECPVIGEGWPGVESELVIRVGRDAPPDKLDWTLDEASEMVGELCLGVEVVSSAFSTALWPGLAACVSDFGFNFGIIAGKAIPQWRTLERVAAQCLVDGEPAARFPSGVISMRARDGVLGGLAFALSHCARRGYPLRAGALIATGTITGGLVSLLPGQSARHVFEGLGEVECRAVQVTHARSTT